MAEHRELVDKRMSAQFNRRVIVPLILDLGARHLKRPWLGRYNDEEKTVVWGLGYRDGGDKRHRSRCSYVGIYYADGEKHEGPTRSIEVDRHLGWSVKHDNRLVQNDERITRKIVSLRGDVQQAENLQLPGPDSAILGYGARNRSGNRRLRQLFWGGTRSHRSRNREVQPHENRADHRGQREGVLPRTDPR